MKIFLDTADLDEIRRAADAGLIDGIVIDEADRDLLQPIEELGIKVLVTNTIMRNLKSKSRLAEQTVDFTRGLEITV